MTVRATRLPPMLEFSIVLGMTYGLMLLPALWRAAASNVLAPVELSDGRLARLALFELVTGGLGVLVLRHNGWRRADLHLAFGLLDLGLGFVLFLAATFGTYLGFFALRALAPEGAALMGPDIRGHLGLPVILLVCVVNPLFEEGILLGYVMKVLRPQGFGVACGVSVLLRLATHLYQGPMAVLSILPLGIFFSAFHWKTRRLWPVVVAHLILDALALLRFAV